MQPETRIIGVDPGYGNFKAAEVTPGGVRVAVVPSVVAPAGRAARADRGAGARRTCRTGWRSAA